MATAPIALDAALAVIPSLPRKLLTRFIQRAIERLDDLDGDADLECDFAEDEFFVVPRGRWASLPFKNGSGCPISDPGGAGEGEDDEYDHRDEPLPR